VHQAVRKKLSSPVKSFVLFKGKPEISQQFCISDTRIDSSKCSYSKCLLNNKFTVHWKLNVFIFSCKWMTGRCWSGLLVKCVLHFVTANNSGVNKRQITDLVDQSIQINAHCFVVTADNRYILICGFWDKSFRVYSTETGDPIYNYLFLLRSQSRWLS